MKHGKILLAQHISPLLKLAIPLILTGIAQSSNTFVMTIFLAHLGQTTLAAGALAGWLYATVVVIAFGTMNAVNVLVAHKHGANDQEAISLILRDGIILAVIVFIPCFLLLWTISPLFQYFGQPPEVINQAEVYLHALAWSLLPDLWVAALIGFIIGLGHARSVLVFSLLSVTLIIFSCYVLIFGKLGLPMLGIAGAGWGVVVGYIITLLMLTIFIFTHPHYRVYRQKLWQKKGKTFLGELIKIGVPMGGMFCFEVGFFFVLTVIMGTIGEVWLAANQVAMQYMGALMGIIFAIAQAITIRMGHLIGNKEILAAKYTAYIGISLAVLIMFFIAISYWTIPEKLIAIDFVHADAHSYDPLIIHTIKQLLFIVAIFQIFESVRIALFGALRALKDTKFTLYVSIFSFWGIALPLGYLLAKYFSAPGLWCGVIVGACMSALLLLRRFQSKIKLLF